MQSRRPVLYALVLALIVAVALPLVAQIRTVRRVAIVASPRAYNGPCPANLEFIATVFVTRHPVWIDYQWERSDGAVGPRQRAEIRSAGQGISTTWSLGGPRGRMVVWERLHVLAPTGVESPMARVRLNCR